MPELTSSERFDLWMRFLQRWPIDKLKRLCHNKWLIFDEK